MTGVKTDRIPSLLVNYQNLLCIIITKYCKRYMLYIYCMKDDCVDVPSSTVKRQYEGFYFIPLTNTN